METYILSTPIAFILGFVCILALAFISSRVDWKDELTDLLTLFKPKNHAKK